MGRMQGVGLPRIKSSGRLGIQSASSNNRSRPRRREPETIELGTARNRRTGGNLHPGDQSLQLYGSPLRGCPAGCPRALHGASGSARAGVTLPQVRVRDWQEPRSPRPREARGRTWMRGIAGCWSPWLGPYCWGRRIADLSTRRHHGVSRCRQRTIGRGGKRRLAAATGSRAAASLRA